VKIFNLLEINIKIKWLRTTKRRIDRNIEHLIMEGKPIAAVKYFRNDVPHKQRIGLKEAKRHVDKIYLRLVYEGKMPYNEAVEQCEKTLLREGITHIDKYELGNTLNVNSASPTR